MLLVLLGQKKNSCVIALFFYYSLNKSVFSFSDNEQELEEVNLYINSSSDVDFTDDEGTTNIDDEHTNIFIPL